MAFVSSPVGAAFHSASGTHRCSALTKSRLARRSGLRVMASQEPYPGYLRDLERAGLKLEDMETYEKQVASGEKSLDDLRRDDKNTSTTGNVAVKDPKPEASKPAAQKPSQVAAKLQPTPAAVSPAPSKPAASTTPKPPPAAAAAVAASKAPTSAAQQSAATGPAAQKPTSAGSAAPVPAEKKPAAAAAPKPAAAPVPAAAAPAVPKGGAAAAQGKKAEEKAAVDLSFRVIAENEVELQWTTVSEEKLQGFILERREGDVDWEIVSDFRKNAALKGKGVNGGDYLFSDDTVEPGVWSYRVSEFNTYFQQHEIAQNSVTIESASEAFKRRLVAILAVAVTGLIGFAYVLNGQDGNSPFGPSPPAIVDEDSCEAGGQCPPGATLLGPPAPLPPPLSAPAPIPGGPTPAPTPAPKAAPAAEETGAVSGGAVESGTSSSGGAAAELEAGAEVPESIEVPSEGGTRGGAPAAEVPSLGPTSAPIAEEDGVEECAVEEDMGATTSGDAGAAVPGVPSGDGSAAQQGVEEGHTAPRGGPWDAASEPGAQQQETAGAI